MRYSILIGLAMRSCVCISWYSLSDRMRENYNWKRPKDDAVAREWNFDRGARARNVQLMIPRPGDKRDFGCVW